MFFKTYVDQSTAKVDPFKMFLALKVVLPLKYLNARWNIIDWFVQKANSLQNYFLRVVFFLCALLWAYASLLQRDKFIGFYMSQLLLKFVWSSLYTADGLAEQFKLNLTELI